MAAQDHVAEKYAKIFAYIEIQYVRTFLSCGVVTFSHCVMFIHNVFVFKRKVYRAWCISMYNGISLNPARGIKIFRGCPSLLGRVVSYYVLSLQNFQVGIDVLLCSLIVNNYSPKWRWLAVDIRELKQEDFSRRRRGGDREGPGLTSSFSSQNLIC